MMTCKSKTIQSQWNQTDIKMDEETNDWQCLNTYFNEDFNMVYSISNNDQHLNILIRFQDKKLARKILTQGFIIWLDKDRTKGVRYIDYIARDRIIDYLTERSDHRPGQQMRPPKNEKVKWLLGNFYLIEGDLEKKLSEKDRLEIRAAAGEKNYWIIQQVISSIAT